MSKEQAKALELLKAQEGEVMTDTAIVGYVETPGPLAPTDVVRQVALIQQVMSGVMKDGEHYGKIPGCGDKPTLLQPGAQILALTFRLAPKFTIDERRLDGGHREFLIECELYSITTGQLAGMGVGMASTMESKWRYRTGPVEFTGQPVPGEYWNIRKTDPQGAMKLLGGRGHQAKKNPDTGAWEIALAGEKVENDNPADVYNTALKIATKRAFVHAVLNTTAASDMFTQDIEDLPVEVVAHSAPAPAAPVPQAQVEPHSEPQAAVEAKQEPKATAATLKTIRKLKDSLGVSDEQYIVQLSVAMDREVSDDSEITKHAAEKLLAAYERKATEAVQETLGAEVKEES